MKIPYSTTTTRGLTAAILFSTSSGLMAQDPEHRWSFNGDLANSGTAAGPDAIIVDPDLVADTQVNGGGAVDFVTNPGAVRLWGGNKPNASYIDLGSYLVGGTTEARTIEIWATHHEARAWSRIFDFGGGNESGSGAGTDYLMFSWTRGTNLNENRLEIHESNGASSPDPVNPYGGPFTLGTQFHIVVVVEPGAGAGGTTRFTWYTEDSSSGDLVTTGSNDGSFTTGLDLLSLDDSYCWLGRAQWDDQVANASYDEVRVFERAVPLSELESYHDLGPDSVSHIDGDSDGLPRWWEEEHGLDDADDGSTISANGPAGNPDGDSADNLAEYTARTDPNNPLSNPNDSDADGLDDSWENDFFGGLGFSATDDPDRDFNNNEMEETNSTDPLDGASFADTDSDGLNDGWELRFFGDLSQTANADTDGDFFTNAQEQDLFTDPNDGTWSPAKTPLLHRWDFNGSLTDLVGSSDATILDPDGNPTTGGAGDLTSNVGEVTLAGGNKEESSYVLLGNNLIGGRDTAISVELWATQTEVRGWSRIFDFGSGTQDYLLSSWVRNSDLNTARTEFKVAGASALIDLNDAGGVYPLGSEHHMLVTLDRLAGGGELRDSVLNTYSALSSGDADLGLPKGSSVSPLDLVDLNDAVNMLGRSQFGDATASARYNEVRIYKGSPCEVVREVLHDQGPDSPTPVDADGDCMPDAWEVAIGLSPTDDGSTNAAQEGALGDYDSDGSNNITEMVLNSDPTDSASTPADIDADGLDDVWELENFGNLEQDGAGDPDEDCDTNLVEFNASTDPNNRFDFSDIDFDGLPDSWEVKYYGDTLTSDGSLDNDEGIGDDLEDYDEYGYGTRPDLVDTDGDGLNDGAEVNDYFSDPLLADSDGDGLTDGEEVNHPTFPSDPTLADTDFDGQGDRFELENGSNPDDGTDLANVEYHWLASELTDGVVTTWLDTNQGLAAIAPAVGVNDPEKDAAGVLLDGDDFFEITAANNPVLGMNKWTATVVFQANGAVGEGGSDNGGEWWRNAALVGSEQGGAVGDWSLSLGADHLAAIGTNDSTTLDYVAGGALNDDQVHIMTGVWDATTATQRFYVDCVLVEENTAHAFHSPAVTGGINFGANFGGGSYYTGRISEVILNTDVTSEADVLALHSLYVNKSAPLSISRILLEGTDVTLTGSNLEVGASYHVESATSAGLSANSFAPVTGSEFVAGDTTDDAPVVSTGGASKLFFRLVEGTLPEQN
ncbi:LamG-like jellyroll fold domain-containing protein [Roseibacillus persicicus]|uniref:LamG-like jellyroll fold domain-containing protein n=1 Tax=Roseibacillus persicicus TaxID=454148 RepID=UPI00398AF60E